jgi:hypothetical protein
MQGFGGETRWNKILERPRRRWDNNIKTDWIYLVHDSNRRRVLVNAVMNLRVP